MTRRARATAAEQSEMMAPATMPAGLGGGGVQGASADMTRTVPRRSPSGEASADSNRKRVAIRWFVLRKLAPAVECFYIPARGNRGWGGSRV